MLFLSCFMPVQPFGKGLHYVLTNLLHPYFKQARITQVPISLIQAFYSLHFSYTRCLLLASTALLIWAWKGKQHTYKHTYI